ncbi:hypothetical protein WJX73_005750 [Symbiochloris irregularis]|uniref:Dynein axonemal light chain 1 n=1 Tax=Symbiochloris irregularis TaxID=706552 RepID=A0AAW1NTU0_9CHLO
MAKVTTCREAIVNFEKSKSVVATEVEKVELNACCPPIERLDAVLGTLKNCKHLALSSNNIDKISSLAGLDKLEILSIGRNLLKKIENLDPVAATLTQLWISYNQIDKLMGVEKLNNLAVLYASNNKISSFDDIAALPKLTELKELLLAGNPLFKEYADKGETAQYRIEVLRRIPQLQKLDGAPVTPAEREAVKAAGIIKT